MTRKFEMTEETVKEEISQASGLSGTVLVIGNFQKADANTPYFITNPRNIPEVIGNNLTYSGSKILNQLFKKDEVQENYGVNGVIALQVGERQRASVSIPVDEASLNAETLTGGIWGNSLKLTLTKGSNNDYLFILTDGEGNILFNINNKPLDVIVKQVNGAKKHISLSLEEATVNEFEEVTDEAFTGGSETSSSFTVENLQTVLDYLSKDIVNIIVFTEKFESELFPVMDEYLTERHEKGKFSIGLLPLKTDDSVKSKITTVDTARNKYGRLYFINQTINDLDEAETCARIAGAIAGLNVKDSLSEYILHDIDSIHPILSETEIEELTAAGIICFELDSVASGNYKVYSSVSSCIEIGDDGQLVPESELHAVRSADYCLEKLNETQEKYLAKTGIKKNKEVLKSELDAKCDILSGDIVESIEVALERDPKNPKALIRDVSITVFNMIEKIHNRDRIVWE